MRRREDRVLTRLPSPGSIARNGTSSSTRKSDTRSCPSSSSRAPVYSARYGSHVSAGLPLACLTGVPAEQCGEILGGVWLPSLRTVSHLGAHGDSLGRIRGEVAFTLPVRQHGAQSVQPLLYRRGGHGVGIGGTLRAFLLPLLNDPIRTHGGISSACFGLFDFTLDISRDFRQTTLGRPQGCPYRGVARRPVNAGISSSWESCGDPGR
jgi:hypothetical protein